MIRIRRDMTNILRNFVIIALILVSTLAADVWDAPVFKIKPGDQLAVTGDDVKMVCSLLEEDDLTVNWRRADGQPLPQGRYKILRDRSLSLLDITANDQATYVCSASNKFGTSEASAKLTVHAAPRFLTKPRNKWSIVGKHVKLRCSVTGNPQPSLFWSKNELLIFQDQKLDRFSVDSEGNLRIEDARITDSGVWECNALSTAGTLSAAATLKVIHSDPTKTCKDWRGRTIFEGDRYYPDAQDLCYRCRCLNASAHHCKTRTCEPPSSTGSCAIWQKVPDECCRYNCIQKHSDHSKGVKYQTDKPKTEQKKDAADDDDNGTNGVTYSILMTTMALLLAILVT